MRLRDGRVDGIVAAIMAAGKAMANSEPEQDISEFLNDPLHG